MKIIFKKNILIIFMMLHVFLFAKSPVPTNCLQIIFVVSDSLNSTTGTLMKFERIAESLTWNRIDEEIPVVIGRSGLGWGLGLHNLDSSMIPLKKEGDGRSPAGVFSFATAFGYKSPTEMTNLKIPYLHNTKMLECIDDVNSRYYNTLQYKDKIIEPDWESAERMGYCGIWYELGVVVNHNTESAIKGSGSCIFLHNWKTRNETTAGCTEMDPEEMEKIVFWLDSKKNPVLVQLTTDMYLKYKKDWKLPDYKYQ